MGVVAKVISGSFGKIIARQKSSYSIELGELLVSESNGQKIILQVYDLVYGSQLSQSALELASGLSLEENPELEFMDFGMRNYTLALLKGVLTVINRRPRVPKTLPSFFSDLRQIKEEDLPFFSQPKSPIFLGKLRSGTKVLNIDVFVDADKALSHHILVSAQTGKGKSNLVKVLLYKAMGRCEAGFLVLDPHDEYYGRHSLGLKDHPRAGDKLVYYTPGKVPVGCRELVFHIGLLKPEHLEGAVQLSDAQWQAVAAYYRTYKENWVEAIMLEKDIKVGFLEATINVVKRRLMQLLDLRVVEGKVECKGIFSTSAGRSTIADICKEVEAGKVVIVDTSLFSKSVEVLVGSLISTELFKHYRYYKYIGGLKGKPTIGIIIEEAPRVLSKAVLERGGNIFSTIAREGRKFKIGLVAITQLPSLIPKEILANMNTKIILGTEMAVERQALISSAAQDLSDDERTIASLDTGEAIITSSFLKMAVPVKLPLFEDLASQKQPSNRAKLNYLGVGLE